jgi:hypothetical protein
MGMSPSTQPRTFLAHPWRIAALLATIANITFGYVNSHGGGHSVAEVNASYPSLFAPAGYASAIWGFIYGGTLLYTLFALIPSEFETRMHDRLAPWLVVLNALASLWIALFTAEQLGPSLLISGAMLTAAAVLYTTASDHINTEHLTRWWRVPFGLWLAWLSVALLANLNSALTAAGFSGWSFSPIWTSLLLLAVAVLAHSVGGLFLDPVLPFVAAWAALAIGAGHSHESTLVTIVAIAVALKCLWLGTRLLAFSTLPLPRTMRDAIERPLRLDPARVTGGSARSSRSASL